MSFGAVSEPSVAGSGQLMNALYAHGLIERVSADGVPDRRQPGAGRLFENGGTQASLRLVDAQPAADTVILRYHP
jgi:hypothetical protein